MTGTLDIRADVELPETFEELSEVGDRRIAKDLAVAIAGIAQPFGQVLDHFGEFGDESLLGQLHRFFKPIRDSGPLLFVDRRI